MHYKRIFAVSAMVSIMVSQVAWARCVCDPADTLCLNNCVNSARDCIDNCSGKSGDSCYTGCINVHWPGATFEDLDDEKTGITITTKKPTPTPSIHKPSTPTTTAAHNSITAAVTATGAHTVVATTAGLPPVDEILPYLISFFGGMIPTELGALASQLSTLPLTGLSGLPSAAISSLLTNGLSALPTGTSMAPSVQTTGVSTPPLTNFPINTLGPSLMTTHTTVTSLVTMTPNATDGSDNISSHGSKSLVDPWILSVACILLLTSHLFILV